METDAPRRHSTGAQRTFWRWQDHPSQTSAGGVSAHRLLGFVHHTAAAVIVSVMMILTVRNFARKRFPDGEDDGRANGRRVFLRRAVIGAVALVATVACSRLLLGLHYPTDVIISATICPLISYAVWCVWNAYESAAER